MTLVSICGLSRVHVVFLSDWVKHKVSGVRRIGSMHLYHSVRLTLGSSVEAPPEFATPSIS